MEALLIVLLISFLLVGGLIFISRIFDSSGNKSTRARKKAAAAKGSDDSVDNTKWRSVKIAPGLICCDYASILAGKVFLSREAPPLPLANCVEKDCRCKYIHLEDRRSGGDRRATFDELTEFLPINQTERRHLVSRRANDLAA